MSDTPEDKPASQAVSEAVTSVIDATLDAIGRPALEDMYNAAVGDRITAWRAKNLANVFRSYQEATTDLPPEGRKFVAEKVGVRFLEEASLEDDPDLQKIWANLLAAASSEQRPEVTTRYVSTAKELEPAEAALLKEAYDMVRRYGKPPSQVELTLTENPARGRTRADIVDAPPLGGHLSQS